MSHKYILVGDLGGSYCRLQIIDLNQDGHRKEVVTKKMSSTAFPSIIAIVTEFFKSENIKLDINLFILAVCGVVKDNAAKLVANLNYTVDGTEISKHFGFRTIIFNDFFAAAYGILALKENDVIPLNERFNKLTPFTSHSPIAIIGAGTGLGQGFIIPNENNSSFEVFASEGGHADFIPHTTEEFEFATAILKLECVPPPFGDDFKLKFNRVDCEDAISGRESTSNNHGVIITKHALLGDPLCLKAAKMFVKLYGAHAGNLAITTLCSNGIFVAGGIAPKMAPIMIKDNLFFNSACDKGFLAPYIHDNVPVYLVKEPDALGLLGCLYYAQKTLVKST